MKSITTVFGLMLLGALTASAIDADFTINVVPAAVFIDFNSSDFSVTTATSQTKPSSIYSMPSVNAGVGIDTDFGFIDITGGTGIIFTDALRSITLQGDVSLQFQAARSLTIGPHLGVVYFVNPSWTGAGDLDFDQAAGFVGGLRACMGDKITYTVAIDMLSTSFDTVPGTGIETSSSLDITAVGIQFGVRGEF